MTFQLVRLVVDGIQIASTPLQSWNELNGVSNYGAGKFRIGPGFRAKQCYWFEGKVVPVYYIELFTNYAEFAISQNAYFGCRSLSFSDAYI